MDQAHSEPPDLRAEIDRLQSELAVLRRSLEDKERHIRNLEEFVARVRATPAYRLYALARRLLRPAPGPAPVAPTSAVTVPAAAPVATVPAPAGAPGETVGPPLAPPTRFFIETTNHCNLDCIMCSRHHMDHPLGSLSLEAFERLLPLMAGGEVHLHGCGEPLVNRRFLAMLEQAKSTGAYVNFNSNFTLVDERVAGELIRLGLDSIAVSLDAATAETYESIRLGARFDEVTANLERLKALKESAGSRLPMVGLEFVAMRRNIGELPALLARAPSLGIDWARVCHLRVMGESMRSESLFLYPELLRAGLEEARAAAAAAGILVHLPGETPDKSLDEVAAGPRPPEPSESPPGKTCHEPWRTLYVQWNGDVYPCCYWARVMGNLEQTSFDRIWQGEEYLDLRCRITAGDLPPECRRCPMLEDLEPAN